MDERFDIDRTKTGCAGAQNSKECSRFKIIVSVFASHWAECEGSVCPTAFDSTTNSRDFQCEERATRLAHAHSYKCGAGDLPLVDVAALDNSP